MSSLVNKIDTWIFDLDNTLYSADSGIFQQVHQLMGKFIQEFLNIDLPESNYLESNADNLNNQIIVRSNGEIIIGSKTYQSGEINLEMALLDNLTVENVVILSIEKKVYHEQTIAIMDLRQKNNFTDIKIKTLSQ